MLNFVETRCAMFFGAFLDAFYLFIDERLRSQNSVYTARLQNKSQMKSTKTYFVRIFKFLFQLTSHHEVSEIPQKKHRYSIASA